MTTRCESCSMTIESGHYCQYCADEAGELHPFEETLERFQQWTLRRQPDLDPAAARRQTLQFMATMPAWSDHPDLRAELDA